MNSDEQPKPVLEGPKRHHFLPRFYLEGFTREGMLAVFDRDCDELRVQQPINTGVIGHFYTLKDTEGRKRFELEKMFSEYESKASIVIDKLVSQSTISAEERSELAIFIAFAAFRTPEIIDSLKLFNSNLIADSIKDNFTDVDTVKEQMRAMYGSSLDEAELEADAQCAVEVAQSGEFEISTDHQWAVGMAIQMSLGIAPILAGRDWMILHRDDERRSFITTDAPVVLTTMASRKNSIWGVGYANTDALVVFPLTESCLLTIYGDSGNFQHALAKRDQIREINLLVAANCQRFVIGRDTALVKSITDRLGLADQQWEAKMQRH